MWHSKTKTDLILEVWEKLDCENVGASEIEAIETVLNDNFGSSALESPMVIARMLADEGADLRHAEIMSLYLKRRSEVPYEAAFRNILHFENLQAAIGTIRNIENLRRKYLSEDDKAGLRKIRETVLEAKKRVNNTAHDPAVDGLTQQVSIEISQWLSVWLQTPDIFDDWVELRQRSTDFVERFGRIRAE